MKEYNLTGDEYDLLQREDLNGKYIIKDFGTHYFKDGESHREDGPALEGITGFKFWYFNGKSHRLDGPAVEFTDGVVQYCINDEPYSSKEEFEIAAYLYKNQLENYK